MWADLRAAFSFLTILPLGYAEGRKPGWSLTGYPVVGAVIGALLTAVATISPFSREATAFLVLLTWVVVTGGLHLDGFGDSCDGLLATVEPARRLEIMKDPRTGSWAVIGLIVLLLGKWTFIASLPAPLLLLPPIVGRWVMVIAVYVFPYARSSGLGSFFRQGLGRKQIFAATLMAIGLAAFTGQFVPVVIAFQVAIFCGSLVGQWALRRLGGGITGDVYGGLCELTELLCLMGLSLWISA
jgi:adenosylcobinamide-GDP ribazoletransferase